MARFDVFHVRGGLALDCQADRLTHMPTRFVVPLEPIHRALLISDRLNPQFRISGRLMLMVTQLAGTIRTSDLGDLVTRLNDDAQQMAAQGALDMLMTGV